MKNILSTLSLIAVLTIVNAQTEVTGIWRLTEMTVGEEKVQLNSFHVDFNKNGKLYVSGRELGSWKYNKSNNTIDAEAEMHLDIINGANKIEKLTIDDLILVNPENGTQTFKRASLPYGKEYKNKIVGEYLFLKVVEKGKTIDLGNAIVHFKNNGTLYFQEMFFGTWRFDKKQNTLNITAIEKDDGFNGVSNVDQIGKELVFTTQGSSKLFLKKIDKEKISKENKASGLTGLWKIEPTHSSNIVTEEESDEYIEANYLFLKSSDLYRYGHKDDNSSGIWIFNKKEKTFNIIGRYIPFSGTNTIIEINDNEFIFTDKNGKEYTVEKTKQGIKIFE